ncbi:hypothetical protein HDU91_004982 [Kappamyces sp. JEL0680]|nr:hypothetical protein HDU91_004982 [Kappamyces sp. JEL0680]
MADTTIPDELKSLSSFLLRANEVNDKDPVVAYYCRLYAVKLAVERAPTAKDSQGFILGLMDRLEKVLRAALLSCQDKVALKDQEAIQNEMIGYAHVENFALKIFLNADNEDRMGEASKKTAKTFLASSTFLEVLKTFGDGDVDGEVLQKIKYAKFKAADILKAFKEGRIPTPGPPGGDAGARENVDMPSAPPDPSPTTAASIAKTAVEPVSNPAAKPIPIYNGGASERVNFDALGHGDDDDLDDEGGYSEADRKAIAAAGKHAKFAQSALLYDDVRTAIDNLELALAKLRPLKIIEDHED